MYASTLLWDTISSYVWACKILLSSLLFTPGTKSSQKFVWMVRSLESNHYNSTTNDLKQENLLTNVVNQYCDKRNGFAKVVSFSVTWFVDISTDFCYKESIKIVSNQPGFYYLASSNNMITKYLQKIHCKFKNTIIYCMCVHVMW